MKNWTIGKRIIFGFSSVILIALFLGSFAYSRLIAIRGSAEQIVGDALPGVYLIGQIDSLARQNQILTYKHILSDTSSEMSQFETQITAAAQDIDKVMADYDKTITRPKDRELFDQIKTAFPAFRQTREDVLKLSRDQKSKEAFALAKQQLLPAYDKLITAIKAEVDFNKQSGDEFSQNIQSSISSAQTGIWIGLLLSLLVGVGISYVIIRGTTRVLNNVAASLNDGSNQVAAASGQVSASSQALAEGSSEQASSLEETSSSLEEMASMTKQNSENARKANEIARQAREAADKGVGDMQTMAAAMAAIKVSSDDIAKIIKTIDEIAFQTNILALNAAVEAARAGEAGMGFAVVADEVRNLAQRCAQAAKETAGKIEGAITKTGQGVEISNKVAAALNEIVAKSRQVDELVTEVANASREQTDGITQINTAVGQMDKVTQSNAATAEECAAAAEELSGQAEVMKQSVAELLQLVGGKREVAPGKPPVHVRQNKPVHAATPTAKQLTPATSNGNGNGHAHAVPELVTAAKRRSDIPLDGDFKDF